MSQTPVAPLAGVRVLDLSRLLPGGYTTQMLADLGADVLKIEEPGSGDYARTMPPFARTVGQAFLAVNRDKRSVALNLKHPEGREALLRLVDGADVLLETFRPGVMARLRLDYETLHARNPRLVVCSISGYGQDGPYSQRAGHDLNYIGYAGLLAHLARPGEAPVLPGAQFADIAGGSLIAATGILAALVGRAATSEGRYVDVSMTDGALSLLPILGTRVLNGAPEPAPGEAELTGALPGYNIYETSDGRYLTVGALEPKFFANLCQRLGRPDLVARQFPRDAADRDATIAELAAIFRTKARDEWLDELADADVCVGPVNTITEALADPQLRARGMTTHGSYGAAEGEGDALRYTPLVSDAPFTLRQGLPALGADTADVLREAGYTQEEITALAAAGAIALGER
jgi:crotonobetainyl-CoA:carnitine CoA-transferase CaiB-like acyl-CoA transferase